MKHEFKLLVIGVLSAMLAPMLSPSANAGPERGAGHEHFPVIHLQRMARGEEAIAALGQQLPAVAAAYGHSPEWLADMLKGDPSLTVDHQGRLLHTQEMDLTPEMAALPTGSSSTNADPLAVGDVFTLHSRLGASRIVYLNFTGCTISGTAWNAGFAGGADIVCAPFDTDGVPSVFSDAEKSVIQEVWQRVAEDYAPFDVDVTTEYPGAEALTRSSTADGTYGMFVVITPTSSWFGSGGGVSYVGCFDNIGDYYKPNFVFASNLLNNAKYVGEACSHEVGHTLGLFHMGVTNGSAYYAGQGTGDTGWAPIMGNSYNENLTQWCKGEYANANNFEDELAIITTGGVDYRLDDHGDTDATATVLPAASQWSASGVIERNTDVDVFAFDSGAGTVAINVLPASKGPDLDILVALYDSTGALLATNNPTNYLTASLSLTVAAGRYYLHVHGTGCGDPLGTGYSSYGCLGTYTLSGTVADPNGDLPPVAVATATPTSGAAPLNVQFNASQSYDPDGSIVSWQWAFGDGSTGTGATIKHTYTAVGAYTAVLTVTDNRGATATNNLVIQVQASSTSTVRVRSISLAEVIVGASKTVRATVNVTDLNGKAISGVNVSGSWAGLITGLTSASTDLKGNAVLTSAKTKSSGIVTFTISNLSKSGYVYDASKNLASSATIAVK